MKNLVLLIVLTPVFSFAAEEPNCDNPSTTLAINQCMQKELVEAEKVMDKYLAKSLERYSDDSVSVASIQKGQEAWLIYRQAHCGAVYDTWRDGTIRAAMGLGCKIGLTHQRTTDLWQSFLTYADSTPPLLPEPPSYAPKS